MLMFTHKAYAHISSIKKTYWLYLLESEDSYFYVGITANGNPYVRIHDHMSGRGAIWTKKHKPKKVLSLKNIGYITNEEAEAVEENATLKLMDIFGYNNVRGGTHCFSGNYVKYEDRYLQTNLLQSHWV